MNDWDNKKNLKNQYRQQQIDEFSRSLPMSVDLFEQLSDFLDENLEEEEGSDFSLTQQFCSANNLDFDILRNWLIENGAGDDSEALWNVEEQFEKL